MITLAILLLTESGAIFGGAGGLLYGFGTLLYIPFGITILVFFRSLSEGLTRHVVLEYDDQPRGITRLTAKRLHDLRDYASNELDRLLAVSGLAINIQELKGAIVKELDGDPSLGLDEELSRLIEQQDSGMLVDHGERVICSLKDPKGYIMRYGYETAIKDASALGIDGLKVRAKNVMLYHGGFRLRNISERAVSKAGYEIFIPSRSSASKLRYTLTDYGRRSAAALFMVMNGNLKLIACSR
jgi:hypothetical protein